MQTDLSHAFVFLAIGIVVLCLGLICLISPSLYYKLPRVHGPRNRHWDRIQIRAVGLCLSLASLAFSSTVLAGVVKSPKLAAFGNGLRTGASIAFFTLWAVLLGLRCFSCSLA